MNRKAFALIGALLMVGGAFLCCSVFTDNSEAAVVDRTVVVGSENCPVTYYYGTPTLKTTYHVYLAAGSFLSICHSSHGTPNTVSGTSEVSVISYTMSNGVNTKKVEGTVNNIGTFTISSSRAAMQSYDPGVFIIHVVQPKSLMLDPGQPFSMALVSIDPAYNPGTDYFGYSEGPEWITETFDGSSETLSGTAPFSPGTYTENFYTSSNKDYKRASINITVRDVPKHTVTYNANGGSCPVTTATAAHGSSVILPSPSKAYSTFAGWYTASSGGTRVGGAGDSYTVNDNVTLHAQYNVIPVSITTTQPTAYLVQGTSFTYTVGTNPSDATVSVSGANWLSVSGKTVSGVPTTSAAPAGTYHVTVTATYGTQYAVQTFDIVVAEKLIFESVPTGGIIATPV